MEIKHSILAISSALLLIGCGGGAGGTDDSTAVAGDTNTQNTNNTQINMANPYPAELLSDDDKAIFLKVINDARSVEQNCGTKGIKAAVPTLRWSDELYSASAEHSNDMTQSDTFQHDGSGTDSDWTGVELGSASKVSDRIENNGYSNWQKIGENITAGTSTDTPQEAIDAWLDSDDHCAILMDGGYNEVGMALVTNDNAYYSNYWTQDFGSRQ
jgi:uncharacterized protein YkwD